MGQKEEILAQLARLATAAHLELPQFDATPMGPLSVTKTALRGLPRESLVAASPRFVGTWLDMLVREVQEVAVDGQVILPGLLPPASMLRLEGATPEQQAVVSSGAVVSIRPPENHLLLLSPVSADAAVYELTDRGLVPLAENVAALVTSEVSRILG